MDLKGKTILLTGANGGIGSMLSKLLTAQGSKLVLCSLSRESLEKLERDLAVSGNTNAHCVIEADIGSNEDRKRIASECEALGGIDVLINLAGVLDFSLFEEQSVDVIERTIGINLLAPMLLCHELLPQLKQKEKAAILNVGSIFGSIGHPGFVAYCASKAGMKTFTEALSRELADTNIAVTYIAPRATATALNSDRVNDMNKALGNNTDTPDYVAREIVNHLQQDKTLSYLGWPEKIFVRLNALLPSVVHNALVKKLGLIKQFARS